MTLVDAENVRRSAWPNISKDELVELVRTWVEATGRRVVLVFDGAAPTGESGEHLSIVGTRGESADDWIAMTAAELARSGRPYRLVTSDRELRTRAGRHADDLVGGGTFGRMLRATSGPSAPSTRAGRASPA